VVDLETFRYYFITNIRKEGNDVSIQREQKVFTIDKIKVGGQAGRTRRC